jgi:O-antigen/teichoic acid export membrane protein
VKLASRFRRNPLVKRLLQVVSGNFAAQLIVLLAAPVITRIYSPEVFGIQGVFLSAVSLLAPLVALRYPMAIVLGRSNREVRQAEQFSTAIAALTCVLLFILLLLAREPVSGLLGLDELGLLILFLPVMLFFTGVQEIVNYRAARFNHFKELSFVTALQAFLTNSGRILGGLLLPVASTLVLISTAGPALHAGLLSRATKKGTRSKRIPRETFSSMRKFLVENKEFPLYRAPADFVHSASQALPVILLTVFSGPAVAGFYTLARSVLNLPANIIGSAIGNVFYAHFAETARELKPLLKTALKTTLFLLVGPGFLVILVCFFAPSIFAFVFGEEWRDAGTYARWMSVWIAFALAKIPGVRVAPVIGRQGVLLVAHIAILVLCIGAMVLAHLVSTDPLVLVIAYSLASAAGNAGQIIAMLIFTHKFDTSNVSR